MIDWKIPQRSTELVTPREPTAEELEFLKEEFKKAREDPQVGSIRLGHLLLQEDKLRQKRVPISMIGTEYNVRTGIEQLYVMDNEGVVHNVKKEGGTLVEKKEKTITYNHSPYYTPRRGVWW